MSASFLDYKLPCEYQEWQKRPDGHLIGILFSASQPPCSSARLDGPVRCKGRKDGWKGGNKLHRFIQY